MIVTHESKVGKVITEFEEGKLHSGSKEGPKVHSHAQAVAIGLSEARKAGEHVSPMPKGNPGPASHGYGHAAPQRQGHLRMSGHPGGHQLGKRK